MSILRRPLGWFAILLAATAMPLLAQEAANIGDVDHPLRYEPPSAKTLELALVDDLSNTVVSDEPQGETGVLASTLEITDEQAQQIRDGGFSVAIAMDRLGDDWATRPLVGLTETIESA